MSFSNTKQWCHGCQKYIPYPGRCNPCHERINRREMERKPGHFGHCAKIIYQTDEWPCTCYPTEAK